jgi:16S rRNA (guanine527-N7)-methyltransferase
VPPVVKKRCQARLSRFHPAPYNGLRMHVDRIAALLAPFLSSANDQRLTTNELQHISTYIDILQRWNARINLTAIRTEEEIVTRHFGESLFAARHLFPLCSSVPSVVSGVRVADVGSGAGFPGIPIKLWAPEIALTLIESNLKEVTRALTLTGVNIQTARAESLAASSFDVVTLRAVERFESILPIAARLVAPAGRLALLVGQAQFRQAQSALPTLGWSDPIPAPSSQARVLTIARKP